MYGLRAHIVNLEIRRINSSFESIEHSCVDLGFSAIFFLVN